jgi:hypothetical protein
MSKHSCRFLHGVILPKRAAYFREETRKISEVFRVVVSCVRAYTYNHNGGRFCRDSRGSSRIGTEGVAASAALRRPSEGSETEKRYGSTLRGCFPLARFAIFAPLREAILPRASTYDRCRLISPVGAKLLLRMTEEGLTRRHKGRQEQD